jgi:hypothetical protein
VEIKRQNYSAEVSVENDHTMEMQEAEWDDMTLHSNGSVFLLRKHSVSYCLFGKASH